MTPINCVDKVNNQGHSGYFLNYVKLILLEIIYT